MHDTALAIGSKFLEFYCGDDRKIVVELGAMDVNGSLRGHCPSSALYLGIDIAHGKGVDLVIDPKNPMPFKSGFSDLTISTSQMEHDPRFWNTFLELCRLTKEGGVIYFSAPSNGDYHSFPEDVWRFYPDAGKALVGWAGVNGYEITLIESFTAPRKLDVWNDFVALFYIGVLPENTPINFLSDYFSGYNAWKFGFSEIQNYSAKTEDGKIIQALRSQIDELQKQVQMLTMQNVEITGSGLERFETPRLEVPHHVADDGMLP